MLGAQRSRATRCPASPWRRVCWRRAILTSWQISVALVTSRLKRTSGSGWLSPATMELTLRPEAAARTSSAGIDGRIVERKLLEDALQVEAVVDFEEAVGDGIPVAQELVVARNAEVEGLARRWAGSASRWRACRSRMAGRDRRACRLPSRPWCCRRRRGPWRAAG